MIPLILVVLVVVFVAAQKSTTVPPNPAAIATVDRAYNPTAYTSDVTALEKTAIDPAAEAKEMWNRLHNEGEAPRATKPAERRGDDFAYPPVGFA